MLRAGGGQEFTQLTHPILFLSHCTSNQGGAGGARNESEKAKNCTTVASMLSDSYKVLCLLFVFFSALRLFAFAALCVFAFACPPLPVGARMSAVVRS
jgi:hypothetical protein